MNKENKYKQLDLDLDLANTDYRNNSNLKESIPQKLPSDISSLMRYRAELNRVVWSGLNAAQTKILTVILSRITERLSKFQNYQFKKLTKGKILTDEQKSQVFQKIENDIMMNKNEDLISATLSYSELRKRIGYTSNHVEILPQINKMKKSLQKWHDFTIDDQTISFPIFKAIVDDRTNKTCTFFLNDLVLNVFLLNPMDGKYVQYPVREIVDLSSVKSQTLLRLLKEFRQTGWRRFLKHSSNNDDGRIGLWELLEVPNSMSEGQFTNRLLKDAIIEISPYFTNLNFKKEFGVKNGHRVVKSYLFTFKQEKEDSHPENDEPEVVISKGLENINSTKCLKIKDKFKAVDKLLGQRLGTAEREYQIVHPEYDKNISNNSKAAIDMQVWDPELAKVSNFSDKLLGKKAINCTISELKQMRESILEQIRNGSAGEDKIKDYEALTRFIKLKQAQKIAKKKG